MTIAAPVITILIVGIMYKSLQTLRKKARVNLTALQTYEMETDALTNGNEDLSAFSNVYANVNGNGMRDLSATVEQSDFHTGTRDEMSEREDPREESSIFLTDDILKDNHSHIKLISEIKMHELHTSIVANGSIFKEEFALLPVGEHHACCVGKEQDNMSKNRYKTIFPCPKNSTMTDFWKMVWQENVTQIVMLTNLMENGKIKCNQYWPEGTYDEFYSDIKISKFEEKHFAFYVIRKFTMTHSEEFRIVTQYHYTKWPDHSTPDPLSLVVFHSHVLRTRTEESEAPTIVHCSAGIGRTGTYIAFDALCKEGKSKGTINVAGYIKVMRSCRMNMVQTYEQYKAIYLALTEEFKAPVHTKSIIAFVESMKHFFGEDSSDHVIFQKEFKSLSDIKPAYNEGDFRDALLHTSFLEENAFIVTKYPSEDGAVDFLRMLIDYESDTVICMDPLAEIESSTSWLPEPLLIKLVGLYSLQHEGGSEIDVKVTNVKILDERESTHSIKIVQPTGLLTSIEDTACLRSLVSYAIHIPTENPVTIVSKDGASLCGVFCAVFNCIQQINMDDSVDVFTTVRQLQTRRPEFCSTLDEYTLVYKSVKDFIETTSEHVYSNL
uniref:Receptor-type tyrosine-protein phosphatase alpha-like n=1 Tax=Crassostrea virginica TaxID=6565 RepID=A0A8B8BXV0_CRAVI|nr:receptor-type tyrosine-protein phosphatase alpha-like [Crassostrea virginica]